MAINITRRWYDARTRQVHSPNLIEVEIPIWTALTTTLRVRINKVSVPATGDLQKRAMHCAVILLGGKNIVLDLTIPQSGVSTTPAQIYLSDKVSRTAHNRSYTEVTAIDPTNLRINYAQCMTYLARNGYDIAEARNILRG